MEVVPALSKDGWVLNSLKKADYLMSHFFISDFSQSYLYSGRVSSLPYIIQNNKDDITLTVSKLEQTLNEYFSKYFNNVVAEVKEIPSDNSDVTLELYLEFIDSEGISNTLSKLIEITDSKITNIININNG